MKRLIIILSILIVIILAGSLWLRINLGRIAGDIILSQFNSSELSSVYHLEFDKLKVNVLSGELSISNFHLTVDTNFFHADDTLRFKHQFLFEATLTNLSLTGLDIRALLLNKQLKIKGIEIDDPGIRVIDHLTKKEKIARSKLLAVELKQPDTTTGKKMSLGELSLEYFRISGGNAEFYDKVHSKSVFSVNSISLLLTNLFVNPEAPLRTLIDKTYKDSKFSLGEVKFNSDKGFYDYAMKGVDLDIAENRLVLNDFMLKPKYGKNQFAKKFGKQTDRIAVEIKTIEVAGFDLERYFTVGELLISTIKIDEVDMEIYRDKNDPFDFENFPKFPWQGLAGIQIPFEIDSISIRNSVIRYEELAPGRTEAGKVPLTNVKVDIFKVSNNPDYIAKNGPMVVLLEAKLFNEGDMFLQINVPSDLASSEFNFHGRIDRMNMQAFNMITELNVLVNIEQGQLDSLVFWANANEKIATGQMVMAYKNLKINVLKKETEKRESNEFGLVSWLSNQVIKGFNPSEKNPGDKPAVAEIFVERDINKSVFNYIVKSLISGIKATLVPGVGQTLKKYEKAQKKEAKKEAKQTKKQERKAKKNN